jgi:hypothetical protein
MYSSHHSTWALNLREELDDRESTETEIESHKGKIPKFHGEFVGIETGVVYSITEIRKGYRFLFRET